MKIISPLFAVLATFVLFLANPVLQGQALTSPLAPATTINATSTSLLQRSTALFSQTLNTTQLRLPFSFSVQPLLHQYAALSPLLKVATVTTLLAATAFSYWRLIYPYQHPRKRVWFNSREQDREAIRCLGYNPEIDFYTKKPEKDAKQVKNPIKSVVLVGYGWGSYKAQIEKITKKRLKKRSDYCLFDFADARSKENNRFDLLRTSRFINFGTSLDVDTIIYVLGKCQEQGYEKINGFYHSRAGASFIRALYALHHPEEYAALWRRLGYNAAKIKAIKDAVDKGYTVLAQPWLDTSATLSKRPLLTRIIVPLFTSYNPFIPSGITVLEKIADEIANKKDETYPSLYITAAKNDNVIGWSHLPRLEKVARREDLSTPFKIKLNELESDDHGDWETGFSELKNQLDIAL